MRNRDYASAIAIWQSAVTAVADNPRAAYNLANRLKETGDAQQAMVYYRQALTLNPDEVGAHNNLGQVLVSVGAAATALDHYHRALELNPNSANVHVNLGLARLWCMNRLADGLSPSSLDFTPPPRPCRNRASPDESFD